MIKLKHFILKEQTCMNGLFCLLHDFLKKMINNPIAQNQEVKSLYF